MYTFNVLIFLSIASILNKTACFIVIFVWNKRLKMLFCNIILAYWYIYFSFAKFYVLFKVNKFEVIQYMLEEDKLFFMGFGIKF